MGSSGSIKINVQVPLEKGTFQDTAAALFNNLTENPTGIFSLHILNS